MKMEFEKIEKGKKRERNVNYTFEETESLIFLIEQRKNIIESKKCDAETWHIKDKAWKEIEHEFNKDPRGVYRSAKHLKLKYESLKKNSKRNCGPLLPKDNKITPVGLTEIHKKVREIISMPADGEEGLYYSDNSHQPGICELGESFPSPDDNVAEDDSLHSTEDKTDANVLEDDKSTLHEVPPPIIEQEPAVKKRCLIPNKDLFTPIITMDVERSSETQSQNEDNHCKSDSLKTPHSHNILYQPEENLSEKINVETLQRRILEEEMKQKIIQTKILQEELSHKRQFQELQKQQLLLRIRILKKALER